MARDYKHRAAGKPGPKPVPFWIWLLIGFLGGALTVGFLCWKLSPRPEPEAWVGEPPEQLPAPAPEPAKPPPPDFDFYDVLPDQEVVVPHEEPPPAAPRRAQPPAQAAPSPPSQAPKRRYLVQVSSVRSAGEAEAIKAKLALLGLQARISRATVKGITWHRVRLGPFDANQIPRVRQRLARNGYPNPMVVPLKK